MKKSGISCFLLFSLIMVGTGFAEDLASATVKPGEEFLRRFGLEVLQGNRSVQAAIHDLTMSRQEEKKANTAFQPTMSVSEDTAHSANRNYNPLTGIDEDYTTKSRGTTISLGQKTPLGMSKINVHQSQTDYTNSQTSHFMSSYLSLEAGILRRDYRINRLEKSLRKSQVRSAMEKFHSTLLDTLSDAFGSLFERLIAKENVRFKERNLVFYQKMLEEAKVKFDNGLGSELDMKQARMRLTIAENDLEESNLSLSELDQKIGLMVGNPGWDKNLASCSPEDLSVIVPAKVDEEDLVKQGMHSRPDLRLLDMHLEDQRKLVLLARENARHDVTTSVSWGRQGRGADQAAARDMRDKSWDLSISWNSVLGKRPEEYAKKMEIERLKALELQGAQTRETAEKAIREKIERLKFFRKSLTELIESQHLAGEILEGQRLNFQLGKTSLLDLLKYQSDFESANLAVIRGEASLAKSWLQILYETGILLKEFRLPENADMLNR